jgi:hypothetical protein
MGPLLAAGVELGLHGVAALCKSQDVSKDLQSLGKALDFGATLVGVAKCDPVSMVRAGAAIVEALTGKDLVKSVQDEVSNISHSFSQKM